MRMVSWLVLASGMQSASTSSMKRQAHLSIQVLKIVLFQLTFELKFTTFSGPGVHIAVLPDISAAAGHLFPAHHPLHALRLWQVLWYSWSPSTCSPPSPRSLSMTGTVVQLVTFYLLTTLSTLSVYDRHCGTVIVAAGYLLPAHHPVHPLLLWLYTRGGHALVLCAIALFLEIK